MTNHVEVDTTDYSIPGVFPDTYATPRTVPSSGYPRFPNESRTQLRSEIDTLTIAIAARYLALLSAELDTQSAKFEKAAGDLALARYHVALGQLRDARSYVTSAQASL